MHQEAINGKKKIGTGCLTQLPNGQKKLVIASFVEVENGVTVNKTEKIASLGGAALDNEETYLLSKLMRGLGVTYYRTSGTNMT